MNDEPLALKMKDGSIYAGCLDEYYYNDGGVVALYHCSLLNQSESKWVDHDIMIEHDGKLMRDPMPDFMIQDIKEILILPKDAAGLYLDDFLKIYLNPYYRPIMGFPCKLNAEGKHTPDCDARLHEALNTLRDGLFPIKSGQREEIEENKIWEAFGYIRSRLILSGAKIP